ncbi:MAG: hypothetical protein E7483_02055 [Ruminococcaceae bacterium]|nr:hypothetical protein [Oscillospiraceae bacterium]
MVKLAKKLAIVLLPIVIYFAAFIYFEPYNYFGLKQSDYTADSAIVRVRNYNADPADVVIVGDSRMAHFDMELVEKLVGEDVGQLAFGGASFNEAMDLLEYAVERNPNVHTIYCEASFYTLNEGYYKDRMSSIETIAENPLAYMLNFNYNIEMLSNVRWVLQGVENVATPHHEEWKHQDYYYEDGTKRPYRRNLEEYALNNIYPVCENYVLDTADIDRYIEIAKMCSEKGIKLYTVMPPVDQSLIDLVVEPLGIGEDITAFIDAVSPYTEVLNFEYNGTNLFSEDLYYDGLHLDVYSGLPIYTEMLFSNR